MPYVEQCSPQQPSSDPPKSEGTVKLAQAFALSPVQVSTLPVTIVDDIQARRPLQVIVPLRVAELQAFSPTQFALPVMVAD